MLVAAKCDLGKLADIGSRRVATRRLSGPGALSHSLLRGEGAGTAPQWSRAMESKVALDRRSASLIKAAIEAHDLGYQIIAAVWNSAFAGAGIDARIEADR